MSLFKRKSKVEKLGEQYRKLLSEAHKLSATNRRQSDSRVSEANEILNQIEILKNKNYKSIGCTGNRS